MASTQRMALRKREAPTSPVAAFARHRAALISRFAKRPRGSDDGGTESDTRRDSSPETDRSLTFLQSAQLQNTPVRSGKWNVEEENYLRKLVHIFNSGVLEEVEQRSSMRMWLAKMLHCCPMRISKKQMHGEKFKGKAKYTRNNDRIDRMGQKEFDRTTREVHQLRSSFLMHWAKEEFGRWGNRGNFGEWYDTVVRTVPTPKLARNERLVPSPPKLMEPWEEVRKILVPLVIVEDAEAQQNRELARKKRALQRHEIKRLNAEVQRLEEDNILLSTLQHHPLLTSATNLGLEASDTALLAPIHNQTNGCPGPCCNPPLICLEKVHDDVFEPMPSPGLEVGQDDLHPIEQSTESCCALTPTVNIQSPISQPLPLGSYTPPSIVLDFGPPSHWNVDFKDQKSSSNSEWVDELLGDDAALALESSLFTQFDLPVDPWLRQFSTA